MSELSQHEFHMRKHAELAIEEACRTAHVEHALDSLSKEVLVESITKQLLWAYQLAAAT